MASPQTQNGYTRIANELLDHLCKIRINGEARQVLDAVFRKTYGYQKREAPIPTSEFQKLTDLPSHAIHKARIKLLSLNLITVTQKGNSQILTYTIQKDYEKWQPLPKKVTVTQKGNRCNPKRLGTVTQKGNEMLRKPKENTDLGEPKDNFKDIFKRKKNKPSREAYRLSQLLWDLIVERQPLRRLPDFEKWAEEMDRLLKGVKGKRPMPPKEPEEVEEMIRWTQEDDFEQDNVLSPYKLRKRYDDLNLKMKKHKGRIGKGEEYEYF